MDLYIKDIFGFTDCNVQIPTGATLVTGKNSTGKTSIARVLAALLAHDDNPSHIAATNKKSYIRDGALEGYAELDEVKWMPKTGVAVPQGKEPICTPYSVGLVNFTAPNNLKARQAIWEALFLPENPRELLEPNSELPKKQLEAVLDSIEDTGDWNEALRLYEEQRRHWKRRWCEVTGSQRWGDEIAAKWAPPDWDPALEGSSEESLTAELQDARDELQGIISTQAISAAEIEKAQLVKDIHLPKAEKALDDFRDRAAEVVKTEVMLAEDLKKKRESIAKAETWVLNTKIILDAKPHAYCPHCNEGVDIVNGKLVPWMKHSPEELNAKKDEFDEVVKKLDMMRKKIKSIEKEHASIVERRKKLNEQAAEQNGIVGMMRQQATYADREQVDPIDESAKSKAEEKASRCAQRLDAYNRMSKAKSCRDNVIWMDEVCQLLGPNGVRAAHIAECVEKVKAILTKIKAITQWLPIDITMDYQVTSNGRPIQLCAKNEQLKAQWALQFACAFYARDTWIVLDEADTLKDESWDGLLRLVGGICNKNPQMRVIVCATSAGVEGWNQISL